MQAKSIPNFASSALQSMKILFSCEVRGSRLSVVDWSRCECAAQESVEITFEFLTRSFVDVDHVAALIKSEVNIVPDGRIQIHPVHDILSGEIRGREVKITAADPHLQVWISAHGFLQIRGHVEEFIFCKGPRVDFRNRFIR